MPRVQPARRAPIPARLSLRAALTFQDAGRHTRRDERAEKAGHRVWSGEHKRRAPTQPVLAPVGLAPFGLVRPFSASTAPDGRPCKPMSLNSRRGGAERSDALGRPGGGGGAREPGRERQQRSYLASVYSIDEEYVFIILFAVINPVFRCLFSLTCRRLSVILASEKHAAHIVHPCGSLRASHCEDNRTNGAIFFTASSHLGTPGGG